MFISPTIFNHFINHWFSVSFIFDYFYKVKENAIKWEKIVVDVQNIVFYRRSVGFVKKINIFYGDLINRIIWRLYGVWSIGFVKTLWKRSIVLYGDSYRKSVGLYGDDQ